MVGKGIGVWWPVGVPLVCERLLFRFEIARGNIAYWENVGASASVFRESLGNLIFSSQTNSEKASTQTRMMLPHSVLSSRYF